MNLQAICHCGTKFKIEIETETFLESMRDMGKLKARMFNKDCYLMHECKECGEKDKND